MEKENKIQKLKAFFAKYNESCMHRIMPYSNGNVHHNISYAVSSKMVRDIGLEQMLHELKNLGYIDAFFLPKDVGGIEIISSYYLVFPLIVGILDLAIKEPYLHFFSVINEYGKDGQKSDCKYWILDNSLYVRYVMKPENDVNIQSEAVVLNQAISELYNESIQNGEPAILKGWNQENFVEPQEDGTWIIEFIFINKEMKHKVLEKYA